VNFPPQQPTTQQLHYKQKIKPLMKKMKKLHYLLIPLLTLALAGTSALAQRTGGQFQVNGSTITWADIDELPPVAGTQPDPGDTISTTVGFGYGVYVRNSGSFAGANGWNIETTGLGAYGIYVLSSGTHHSFFSGSNLSINTGNNYGAYSSGTGSMLILTSSTLQGSFTAASGGTAEGSNLSISGGASAGTAGRMVLASSTVTGVGTNGHNATFEGSNLKVTTTGSAGHGISLSGSNSVVNVTDSEFVLAQASAALVDVGASGITTGTATLTRVTADLAGGSGYVFRNIVSSSNYQATLNINESNLTGGIWQSGNNVATINLSASSTLTGHSEFGSGLPTLNVNIEDGSRWNVTQASKVTNLDIDGTLGVTLTGTGYTGALVTLYGELTVDSLTASIMPIFAPSFVYGEDILYSYQIFNSAALGVDGSDFLSLVDWSNLSSDWVVINASFTDGVLKWGLQEYVPPPIPEPTTYALMLGGLGVLGYLQRARRKA